MTLSIVAVSSIGSATGTRTLPVPTGTLDGDLLLMFIAINSDGQSATVPDGYTLVPDAQVTGGSSIQVYEKIAASEPANYSIPVSGSSASTMGMMALRTDSMIGQVPTVEIADNQTNGSSTNREYPSVVSGGTGRILVCVGAHALNQSNLPDAACAEQIDTGSLPRLYCMSQTGIGAGATGTRTATGASAATSKTVSLLIHEADPPPTTEEVRVTQMGVYAEIAGDSARVTQMGVYTEIAGDSVRVTQMGVYVELEEVIRTVPTYIPGGSGNRRIHVRLPEEQVGYAFDPEHSWWSVVVPEASRNLIHNASFEAANLEYTDSGLVSSTFMDNAPVGATRGRTCVRLIYDGTEADFEYTNLGEPMQVAPGPYTWSFDVYCTLPGFRIIPQIRASTTILAQRSITFRETGWQRHSISFVSLASGSRQLRLALPAGQANATIYTDGWQFEPKAYETTFLLGDMLGWYDQRPNQSYYFEGLAHRSASVRFATTGSGGRVVAWHDEIGFLTTGIVGLGMAPVAHDLVELSNRQEVMRGIDMLARDFTLTGRLFGCDWIDLKKRRKALIDLIRPNHSRVREPLILRYQAVDSEGYALGFPLDIVCAYKEGMQGNITNLYQETIGMQFHASEPFLAETIDSTAALETGKTLVNNLIVYRDADGEYFNLGVGASNGALWDGGFLRDGTPVLGGYFSALSGDAVANLAEWDGANWQQIGALNNGVIAIDTGARLGYSMIIGGEFTLDGASPLLGVAQYVAGVLVELADGLNDAVTVVRRHPDGDVYVGGIFQSPGTSVDTDISRIVRWVSATDTWAAMGKGANGTVRDILIGDDGYIYIVGDFTLVTQADNTTVTDARHVARFNTATSLWEPMLEGLNDDAHHILYGPDRAIYVMGDFTLDGTGDYTLSHIARWNGTSWEPVLTLSDSPEHVWLDQDGVFWFSRSTVSDYYEIPEFGRVGHFGWKNGVYYPPEIYKVGVAYTAIDEVVAGFGGREALILVDGNELQQGTAYTVPALNRIDYLGDADSRPTLVFDGEQRPHFVQSHTANAGVYFRDTLATETVEEQRLALSSVRHRFYSNTRPNLMRHISTPASDLENFRLIPGENLISLLCTGDNFDATIGGEAYLLFRNRYLSIDAAVTQ